MKRHLWCVVGALVLIGVLGVSPGVAADTGKIAYMAIPYLNEEIFVMNADGTGQVDLTNNEQFDCWPSWSPDGSRIAYVHETVGSASGYDMEIWVMNADGTGQTRLTFNNAVDYMPVWSPDGSKIAWESNHAYEGVEGYDSSAPCDIWVMNADGSDQTRLTVDGGHYPTWSPDGPRIAFSHGGGIWVMNGDGTDQAPLTVDGINQGINTPRWSPDGTRIAFSVWADSKSGVWVANADGTDPTFLTSGSQSTWSPDGSWIAFYRDSYIWTIHADGSGETVVLEGDCPSWGPSGSAAPTAAFTSLPAAPLQRETVTFTDGSSDTDGTIAGCSWDFGDGGTATETNPQHAYATAGTYTVTLTVTDDDGLVGSETATITVRAPVTATDDLTTAVDTLGLPVAIERGLLDKLAAAEAQFDQGKVVPARQMLLAFVAQVNGQRGKVLAPAQADALIAEAQRINASIS